MREAAISVFMMDQIKSSVDALTDDVSLVQVQGMKSFFISRSGSLDDDTYALLFYVKMDHDRLYIYLKN